MVDTQDCKEAELMCQQDVWNEMIQEDGLIFRLDFQHIPRGFVSLSK